MQRESYPRERESRDEDPTLGDIFEDLYTEKQAIYPASFNMSANSNPSDFLCSGGSSSYLTQPIDRDKKADLKRLYETTLKRLQQVDNSTLDSTQSD